MVDMSNLETRLDALNEQQDALIDELRQAMARLVNGGGVIPEAVVERIQRYGRDLASLRDDLCEAWRAAGGDPRALSLADSLAALTQSLEELRQHERTRRHRERIQTTRDTVTALASLHSADDSLREPIAALRRQLTELQEQLAQCDESGTDRDPESVLASIAPLDALRRLIQERDSLDHGESLALRRKAETHIDEPLLWAAAMGQLSLTPEPGSHSPFTIGSGDDDEDADDAAGPADGARSGDESSAATGPDDDHAANDEPERATVHDTRVADSLGLSDAPPSSPQQHDRTPVTDASPDESEIQRDAAPLDDEIGHAPAVPAQPRPSAPSSIPPSSANSPAPARSTPSATTSPVGFTQDVDHDERDEMRTGVLESTASGRGVRMPWSLAALTHCDGKLSTHDVADAIRNAGPEHRSAPINELIWCLLRDDRLGLAYHLANFLEVTERPLQLPAIYIEALVRVTSIESNYFGPNAEWLFQNLYSFTMRPNGEHEHDVSPHDLIRLAAALRPALVAPVTGAASILKSFSLEPRLEALDALRRLAAGDRTFLLTPALLKGDRDRDRWLGDLESMRRDYETWLSRNKVQQLIFARTTNVWRQWLEPDQPLGGLFQRVLNDERDEESLAAVKAEIKNWESGKEIDRKLKVTDERLRGALARRRPIEARARTAIHARVKEAIGMLEEWLNLIASEPGRREVQLATDVAECRRNLLTMIPRCRDEMAVKLAQDPALPLTAACKTVARALDDLANLVGIDEAGIGRATPAKHRLCGELPRIPRLHLDDEWRPVEPASEQLLLGAVELITDDERTWSSDLEARWEDEDYEAAWCILEVLKANPALLDVADADEALLRYFETQDARLQQSKRTLTRLNEKFERDVQRARLQNLITEDHRLALIGRMSSATAEKSSRVWRTRELLEAAHEELESTKRECIEQFRAQLAENQAFKGRKHDQVRLQRLIENGDLVAAHDYVVLIERGEELPSSDPGAESPGLDFFSESFDQVESLFGRGERRGENRRSLRDLAYVVGERRRLAHLELSSLLTPNDAKRCQDVLNTWRRLGKRQGSPDKHIQQILEFIGFAIQSLRANDEMIGEHLWFELHAEPITSRDDCTLPDLGSACSGHYDVVCFKGSPLESEILKELRRRSVHRPVLAFFRAPMSRRRRRDLAHSVRKSQRRNRLLVLDDVLLFYLCIQKRRLPAFFNAASQFSVAEPYSTAAGHVPPEMFFGREREIRSVFQPDGTNLVYGGRQLGKTALLREVKRRYHNPTRGVVVEFIDLKHGEHLGLTRDINEIWMVLAATLSSHGVVVASTLKPKTLHRSIICWLDEDKNRRIVLLLDESDIFLGGDAKDNWKLVGELKSIMDDSSRRFKVVFAGLHNVQRTSHDVNTPLAHLGTPVCIGPFLSSDEMRDADEMIRLPFRAMGYHFESEDLIFRILAQTNFYPSLIQIFCKRLLELLSKSKGTDPNTPPYVIRRQDVETAHTDRELLDQIRDRFRWTLQLDNRYRVIALCLAVETVDRPEAATQGFPLDEIRELAPSWWPAGFAAQSPDAFRALLLEMIELGVLREVGPSRYAMRSPNFIGLLGSENEIWAALEHATSLPPKIEYEASTFRRVFDSNTTWRRSPLTAAQESQLLDPSHHGLFVIFGTEASGLDEVIPFLEILDTNQNPAGCQMHQIREAYDGAAFQKQLAEIIDGRGDGTTVVLIPHDAPWGDSWVDHAAKVLAVRRGKTRKRFIKLIFLAGPREAWWWSSLPADHIDRLRANGLSEVTLAPWSDMAVAQWQREAEFGGTTDAIEIARQVRQATGHWCQLVCDVGKRCVNQPHRLREVLDEYHQEITGKPDTLRRFGLRDEAMSALINLADWNEPLSVDELRDLAPPETADSIDRVIHWADLLHLVIHVESFKRRLDPFLAELLRRHRNDAT